MFDEQMLRLLAKAQWGANDLHEQMDLTPEERDAANQLAEQLLVLTDEHYSRLKARDPGLRKRYFIAAVARAMAGVNSLAQMHEKDDL